MTACLRAERRVRDGIHNTEGSSGRCVKVLTGETSTPRTLLTVASEAWGYADCVQTFLPYADFARSARVLDDRRLGKQRVEALQILNALGRERGGWVNHPAVRMWRGFEPALKLYAIAICDEWAARGYQDTVREQILARCEGGVPPEEALLPPWLGEPAFHRSHQSNLIRKDPAHYMLRFSSVPPDLPYAWPA